MFFSKLFKKKTTEEEISNMEITEPNVLPAVVERDNDGVGEEKGKAKKNEVYHEQEFLELATLLGTTVKVVKDDCLFEQIKKIMAGTGKVIVRHAPTKDELANIIYNCRILGVREILFAPSYITEAKKIAKKQGYASANFSAIVDFPFGETTFKSKLVSVKDMISERVESVAVMMPSMLLAQDKIKQFKKQVIKFNKLYRGKMGIALSASDIDEDKIKLALKTVDKIPLAFVTFIFGDVPYGEVLDKLKVINKYKGGKRIKILSNVVEESAVLELKNNGVDLVLSPFADKTGKALVERFKVDGVKFK